MERLEKSGKKQTGGDKTEENSGQYLDMYSSIYSMRQDLERIKKPVGSRENPVRTCKDLFYGHPQFKDGEKNKQSIEIGYDTMFFQGGTGLIQISECLTMLSTYSVI